MNTFDSKNTLNKEKKNSLDSKNFKSEYDKYTQSEKDKKKKFKEYKRAKKRKEKAEFVAQETKLKKIKQKDPENKNKLKRLFYGVGKEFWRVTWPTKKEMFNNFITVIIISLILAAMMTGIAWIITDKVNITK
ncbi:MAG: preprotein translocase subunit SecE [Mycoplasmoidaceae bacterium]